MTTTKIALVTGSSRGLGKNTALALAKKGIGVIVTYRSSEAEANSVVAAIAASSCCVDHSNKNLVEITPPPIFTRFARAHNWMFGRVKVLGSVFVFRRVTAADVSADEAFTQMHPSIAHCQTFLTPSRTWGNGLN